MRKLHCNAYYFLTLMNPFQILSQKQVFHCHGFFNICTSVANTTWFSPLNKGLDTESTTQKLGIRRRRRLPPESGLSQPPLHHLATSHSGQIINSTHLEQSPLGLQHRPACCRQGLVTNNSQMSGKTVQLLAK